MAWQRWQFLWVKPGCTKLNPRFSASESNTVLFPTCWAGLFNKTSLPNRPSHTIVFQGSQADHKSVKTNAPRCRHASVDVNLKKDDSFKCRWYKSTYIYIEDMCVCAYIIYIYIFVSVWLSYIHRFCTEYIYPNILSAISRLLQDINCNCGETNLIGLFGWLLFDIQIYFQFTLVASAYRPTDAINMCGLLAAIFSPEFFEYNDLTARSTKNRNMRLEWISFKASGFTFKTQRWTIIWNWKHDGAIDAFQCVESMQHSKNVAFCYNDGIMKRVFEVEKRRFLDGISCLGWTEAFDSIMANRMGIAFQNWWFWGEMCVCVCVSLWTIDER